MTGISAKLMSAEDVRRSLSVRDLTDEAQGPHAMQILLCDIEALREAWGCEVLVHRESPIVSTEENYDKLHYPPEGASRDARYTRYLNGQTILRTQTSVMIPGLLRRLAQRREPWSDVLLVCPGLVYRRDAIDRVHTGEPHQMDLWRIKEGPALSAEDLSEMLGLLTSATLPKHEVHTVPAEHPYTTDGLQIDAWDPSGSEWVEIGECGMMLPDLLRENGLDPIRVTGLAMGVGLDRLLMLRKGMEDIRLLRSDDPRIVDQMLDLSPYRPVSDQPAIRRDLSIAVPDDRTAEELGDRVREALGQRSELVEGVEVISETTYDDLPPAAVERLGISSGQKNTLLRVVLRDLRCALTDEEANKLRDEVYAAVHEGAVWQWASRSRRTTEGCSPTMRCRATVDVPPAAARRGPPRNW
jgi:phenylalanyl-tRNA synthetase alpha chain